MQAKLFMIPWIIELVVAQRAAAQQPNPVAAAPSTQVLTNELLVDAHHRHFYEMLRRQQQINDALLLNNALLHPHIPPLLPPPPPLFNPFVQPPNQGSTSKLGTYGKEDDEAAKTTKDGEDVESLEASPSSPEEKEGTVEAPQRGDVVKKTLAGVKTVSIQRKGEVSEDVEKVETTTSAALSAEDLEVVQLFKKLNLSKEEAKSIVEHVEQVVRHKLISTTTTTTAPSTTSTTPSTTTTTTTTTTSSTTTEDIKVEDVEELTTTTVPPPQMRVRSEENLILQRNNLKHHPIKLQSTKKLPEASESAEVFQGGSIKTSLTHLPIIVTNEEEDVNNPKATLRKRILIASHDRENENDRDLLVDFATGAPLDLSADPETSRLRTDQQLAVAVTVATSTSATSPPRRPPPAMPSSLPPRQTHHEVTNFERLATDYRRRLENTGDLNRILQKISENAYISLERGGARKLFASEARRV